MQLVNRECLNDPLGSASVLLADPVRRYVLKQLLKRPSVTERDVLHGWPGLQTSAHQRLTQMVQSGWLDVFKTTNPKPSLTKKTMHFQLSSEARQSLVQLHAWLTDFLAALPPLPEVTDETHP